jgi:hypothetical protein
MYLKPEKSGRYQDPCGCECYLRANVNVVFVGRLDGGLCTSSPWGGLTTAEGGVYVGTVIASCRGFVITDVKNSLALALSVKSLFADLVTLPLEDPPRKARIAISPNSIMLTDSNIIRDYIPE